MPEYIAIATKTLDEIRGHQQAINDLLNGIEGYSAAQPETPRKRGRPAATAELEPTPTAPSSAGGWTP